MTGTFRCSPRNFRACTLSNRSSEQIARSSLQQICSSGSVKKSTNFEILHDSYFLLLKYFTISMNNIDSTQTRIIIYAIVTDISDNLLTRLFTFGNLFCSYVLHRKFNTRLKSQNSITYISRLTLI
jgi:hypothetical protein